VVAGALSSTPVTSRLAPLGVIEVNTGKFCRLFGPASASSGSLSVTPTGSRSIPSPSLPAMSLPRILLPVPLSTRTPGPLLPLMTLPSPALVPPIWLSTPRFT